MKRTKINIKRPGLALFKKTKAFLFTKLSYMPFTPFTIELRDEAEKAKLILQVSSEILKWSMLRSGTTRARVHEGPNHAAL